MENGKMSFYFVVYDCDGLGRVSNESVVGPFPSVAEAEKAYPRTDEDYKAGGYDDVPVYRTNSYNCLSDPYETYEDAEDSI